MGLLNQTGRVSNDASFARIGYKQTLVSSNVEAAEGVLIPNTWERWVDASGTMQASFRPSGSVAVNYIAIGAHNLGSKGSTVTIETAPTVAGTFTVRGAATPIDNTPLFFQFDEVADVEDVRITITGGTDREVGVIYAGEVMIMQQAIYGGHSPVTLSSVTEYRNATSDTGQFLGRKIRRKGQQTAFSWQNLTDDWYRSTFHPFVLQAKTRPFFIQWRPDYFTNEIAFGFSTGDITPTNQSGTTRLMSVDMQMRAHDE